MSDSTAARRLGAADSAVSTALLDATERVLRRDGYGALSSRRVAEEAGIKQQLVYYYFRTMDDLLLATFRRRAQTALQRLTTVLATDNPLQALWQLGNNTTDARLTAEFMALSNHHPLLREAAARFVEESRRLEAAAVAKVFTAHGIDATDLPPAAITFIVTAISQWLVRERQSGITSAHDEVIALVERLLARFA